MYSLKCDKIIPPNATLSDIGPMIVSLNKILQKKNNEIKKLESQNFYLKENEDVELLHEHNRQLKASLLIRTEELYQKKQEVGQNRVYLQSQKSMQKMLEVRLTQGFEYENEPSGNRTMRQIA